MSGHLQSAALVARSILEARHPDQTFIVSVGEGQGGNRSADAATAIGQVAQGAAPEQPHSITDGRGLSATNRPDDHGIEKAA